MTCPFCRPDERKERILDRSTHCFVLLSNPRLMPGHLLVVPTRHVEQLTDLPSEERDDLFATAITWQNRLMDRLASGCDLRQHCRPFLEESALTVRHVHLHLQPRFLDDELYQHSQIHEKKLFAPCNNEEQQSMKKCLMSTPP